METTVNPKNESAGPGLRRAGELCFWAGLIIELLIVIVDKSNYTNPIEGQLFRITFLLFALKVSLTEYSLKEWLWMLFFLVIAGLCYLQSGRDEAVRLVVFLAAFKNMDVRKTLQAAFWITAAGCCALALLSVFGIYGKLFIIDETGRGIRYSLGLGHPNALYCMFWAVATLGIYLYWEKMKVLWYLLLGAVGLSLFWLTDSRTGIIFMLFTLCFSAVLQYGKKLRERRWVYIAGIALFLLCVAISVAIACFDKYTGPFYPFDRFLTGRITSSLAFEDHGGLITNWRLFSRPENVKYFDLGYMRLFYWYGIIPGIVYVAMYALLLWECFKRGDTMGYMMALSFALYTVLEAHFVSVYLGRNYAWFLMGAYWSGMLHTGTDTAGAEVKRAYWWQGYRLLRMRHPGV